MRKFDRRLKRDLRKEYRTKSRAYKARLLNELLYAEDVETDTKNRLKHFSDIWNWD